MHRTILLLLTILVLSVLLFANSANAHDYWLRPSTFQPPVDSEVSVVMEVGHALSGDPIARKTKRVEQFTVVGPEGKRPVPGSDGDNPAGVFPVSTPGIYVIGFASKAYPTELEPAKFKSYLKEEGLDRIIKLREQRGESDKPGREIFARCAKSLLSAGEAEKASLRSSSQRIYDTELKMKLELIPEKNPYELPTGDVLPVRLVYEGEPLEGALVDVSNSNKPDKVIQQVRTDHNGRVNVKLTGEGVYLITAVHMIEAPADAESVPAAEFDPDWQSYWASLTFEVDGREDEESGQPEGNSDEDETTDNDGEQDKSDESQDDSDD